MITKDMIIGDVINEHPELVRTFFANGMPVSGQVFKKKLKMKIVTRLQPCYFLFNQLLL